MRTLQLFTLALIAVSLQAEMMSIQDTDGTISVTSTSPRLSLAVIGAPSGKVFWDSNIPDENFGQGLNISYPGGVFIAATLGTLDSNPSTYLRLDPLGNPYGAPIPCGFALLFAPCGSGPVSANIVWADFNTGGNFVTDTVQASFTETQPMDTISGSATGTVELIETGYVGINFLDPVIATAQPDANGNYSFTGLVPWTYQVEQVSGTPQSVLLTAFGQNVSGVDVSGPPPEVPEPSSLILLLSVIAALGIGRSNQTKNHTDLAHYRT